MVLSGGSPTFGVGLFTGQHPGAGPPLYRQALTLAQATEDAGLAAFWVSEHHGLADGYLPSPLPLLAAVAAVTDTVALGAGLVVAPLHHPVRLAEDSAVVDQISEGRLLLGLGLGYAAHEYRTFDVSPAGRGARLEDLVSFLRTAWRGEPFDWDGPALTGHDLRVTPKPVQDGGIPVWLGGYASASVRRAGRVADGYLAGRGDPHVLEHATTQLRTVRSPHDPSFTVAVNLTVALSGTPDEDRRVREGLQHQRDVYDRIQHGREVYGGLVPAADLSLNERDRPGPGDAYLHAAGDADEVAEQVVTALKPLQSWARVHVVLRALVPETDLDAQQRRIHRLGAEVVPRVRAGLPAG